MPERYELTVPTGDVAAQFESVCKDLGVKAHGGTLAQFPESTHWHITKPREKGTLEATWSPTNHRLWLEVRANRFADWMPPVIKALQEAFSLPSRPC